MNAFSDQVLVQAHTYSKNNKEVLLRSKAVGCFSCCEFVSGNPAEFRYVNGGATALCPSCGVDALVGSAAVTPMTREFLHAMHNRWFSVFGDSE